MRNTVDHYIEQLDGLLPYPKHKKEGLLEEFRIDAQLAMKDSDNDDAYTVFGSPRDVAKNLSQGHDWGTQRASWKSRTLAFIIDVMIQVAFIVIAAVGFFLIFLILFPDEAVFQWFNWPGDSPDWLWTREEGWSEWVIGEGLTLTQGIFVLILVLFFIGSFLSVIIGYEVVLERVFSQTIGKKLLGLMVVDQSGIRITWIQAVIRNLSKVFDLLLLDAVLGMILEKQDPEKTQKQRGMDILAETIVVQL
ncbi:MAG: RDD family protein [Candidatus Hodarchaeota archaeon]